MVRAFSSPKANYPRDELKVLQLLKHPGQRRFGLLASGDIAADRDVPVGLAALVEERHDSRIQPIVGSVLCPVPNPPSPDAVSCTGAPHVVYEPLGVIGGVDDAVVLTQEILPRILGDLAEPVVDVSDLPALVGDRDYGSLV